MAEEEGVKILHTCKKQQQLKHHFGIEPYLETIFDFDFRKCISSFHISAHKLRGRYKGERLEKRLCEKCNVVEAELHFYVTCVNAKSTKPIGK